MRLLVLITALLFLPSAQAAPDTFSLVTSSLHTDSSIVQQPGAVNPYDCLWDVDDYWTAGGSSRKILAGDTNSVSVCLIADTRIPFWGVRVWADAPTLDVSLTFEPQGVTWHFSPEVFDRSWEWRGCLYGPFYPWGLHTLPEIPDTNGGRGIMGAVTFTVTNTAERFVANPSAVIIERPGLRSSYCKGEETSVNNNGEMWRIAGVS